MPVRWDPTQVDGSTMRTYTAVPASLKAAGIIVAHHGPGLDAFMQDVVHRLFRAGYAVAMPDLYHRQPTDIADTYQRMALLTDDEIIRDMNAAFVHLKGLKECAVGAIGIVGFCMGGRTAYLMAAAAPELEACCVFYGGNLTKAFGGGTITPFDRTKEIGCPIIGFFGNEDTNPSPDDVLALEAELTRLHKLHEFHRYKDAGHAFLNFTNADRYRTRPARVAWSEMLEFLHQHLRV